MATRATITLKIKDEDLNKTKKFDIDKLPENTSYNDDCIENLREVTLNKPYISIYHHFDGYPDGLGVTLFTKFNDYDKALNILLGGDASSINGDTIIQYCPAYQDEDWDSTKPDLTDEIPSADQDYQYYFDGEKWWFRGYEKTKWKDLEKFLRENNLVD